jgi:uncharacterized protein (DUF1697 family)
MNYLALLRGINVGGKSMIAMSELRTALQDAGFQHVRTYIQSGNVLVASSANAATARLAAKIESAIQKTFAMNVGVAVFSEKEWQEVVQQAPQWWGRDKEWKHNLLALLPGTEPADVIDAMAALNPSIERVAAGRHVVYQSLSSKVAGRTTSSKLPSHSIYRRLTVRNYNTTQKLAELLRTQ